MTQGSGKTIRVLRGDDGVAIVTLARPQVHNAFNEVMVGELTASLRLLGADDGVRAVVLRADGKSFSAGADLEWMQRMSGYDPAESLADAGALAELMRVLDRLAKPTIARVHGPAFGGGVGLVACCDIALAADTATFCLSEVRLGLIPAVISPYVIAAMGARAARRWFLTAERFDAAEARRVGLIHQVTAAGDLDGALRALLGQLRDGAPGAVAAAKDLIFDMAGRPITAEMIGDTAQRIACRRGTAEGREGIAAFLEKRAPAWRS